MAIVLFIALALKGVWKTSAYNAILIMCIFYAVSGFALIEYVLRKLRLPIGIKIVFYLGLAFSGYFGVIIPAIAGLADSHFDFRKIRARTVG